MRPHWRRSEPRARWRLVQPEPQPQAAPAPPPANRSPSVTLMPRSPLHVSLDSLRTPSVRLVRPHLQPHLQPRPSDCLQAPPHLLAPLPPRPPPPLPRFPLVRHPAPAPPAPAPPAARPPQHAVLRPPQPAARSRLRLPPRLLRSFPARLLLPALLRQRLRRLIRPCHPQMGATWRSGSVPIRPRRQEAPRSATGVRGDAPEARPFYRPC